VVVLLTTLAKDAYLVLSLGVLKEF